MPVFFENSAEPGGSARSAENLDDQSFDRLKAQWTRTIAVSPGASRAILEAGVSGTAHDLAEKTCNRGAVQALRREVRQAFGYPKPMLGGVMTVNVHVEAGGVRVAKW